MTPCSSDHISVLSHIISSPIWDGSLMDRFPGEMGAARNVVSLITISLYQAVAVVEKGLPSSSPSDAGSQGSAIDPAILHQMQACMAGVTEALPLISNPPDERDSGASLPAPPTQQSSYGANVSSAALSLLRSSLAHLREAVKSLHRNGPFVPKVWELINAELLLGELEDVWGMSSCGNAACAGLEGPCELEAKTLSCGGLCGARYCNRDCQVQAWRAGHVTHCATMKEMKGSDQQQRSMEGISPFQVFFYDVLSLACTLCHMPYYSVPDISHV
jgi:hypothetical protein